MVSLPLDQKSISTERAEDKPFSSADNLNVGHSSLLNVSKFSGKKKVGWDEPIYYSYFYDTCFMNEHQHYVSTYRHTHTHTGWTAKGENHLLVFVGKGRIVRSSIGNWSSIPLHQFLSAHPPLNL